MFLYYMCRSNYVSPNYSDNFLLEMIQRIVFKEWFFKPAVSASLENLLEIQSLSSTPNLQNQKFAGWGPATCVLTCPPNESDAC